MQIFICSNGSSWQPGESVRTHFDGKMLRTTYNGVVADNRRASIGECFNVTPRNKKKPIVEKAKMPDSRGKKIAWAMSFTDNHKQANSIDDFYNQCFKLLPECSHSTIIVDECGSYAIMFAKRKEAEKKTLRPVLAYVLDTISKNSLDELISEYRKHHQISCPENFIKSL